MRFCGLIFCWQPSEFTIFCFLRDNSIFCVSNFQPEAVRLTVLRRAQLIFDATTREGFYTGAVAVNDLRLPLHTFGFGTRRYRAEDGKLR